MRIQKDCYNGKKIFRLNAVRIYKKLKTLGPSYPRRHSFPCIHGATLFRKINILKFHMTYTDHIFPATNCFYPFPCIYKLFRNYSQNSTVNIHCERKWQGWKHWNPGICLQKLKKTTQENQSRVCWPRIAKGIGT
jgi:hypothetical protein